MKNRIHPQELANEARAQVIYKDLINLSDNFENQFELPILFYVGMILVFLTGNADSVYLAAAWLFVAFRLVHTLIHCTSNKVLHRFYAYLASSFVLWGIWLRMGYQILDQVLQ